MDDPWGRDTPPALTGEPPPLPPRLAELAALTGPRDLAPGEQVRMPNVTELPEVQALAAEGWHAVDGAPMFCGLPAVWPAEHRCWVPDRLPRVSLSSCSGHVRRIEPWTAELRDEWDDEWAAQVAECGLPPEPPGRIWLLRSPWPSLGFEVVLSILVGRANERHDFGGYAEITAVAREMLTWPEDQVWDSWHGPMAETARQWHRFGRVGEEAAGVVLSGLAPDHLATLAHPDGAALTEAQAIAWSEAVDELGEEAVRVVQGWRAIGLPPDPPPEMKDLGGVAPDEAADWLAAGFTLADMVPLRRLPMTRAVRWREAGFTPKQTVRLLNADPGLTPDEACAFTEAGVAEERRLAWVEAGFSADEARAWTDLDVLPQEARVWRSVGKGPDEAREQRQAGGGPLPPDIAVGWTGYGTSRESRQYGVTDPSGTRGRIAHDQGRRGRHY